MQEKNAWVQQAPDGFCIAAFAGFIQLLRQYLCPCKILIAQLQFIICCGK